MKETLKIEHNYKRVAELLKSIVNGQFGEDTKPYPEAEEKRGATLFDIMAAIDLLEQQETKITHVVDD